MWTDPRYGRLIFDTIPHGIFTVDKNRRITSFNKAAEAMTGVTAEQAIGKPCSQVLRADMCADECFLRDSIVGGQAHRDREATILDHEGQELPVAVSTAALRDRGGKIAGGVEMFRDLSEIASLRRQLQASVSLDHIVTRSPTMRGVCDMLPLVARSDSTALIEGEPGTGKELVARAIHNMGPRASSPFVAINCGALPESLVESELFGHVKGAFTDARKDRAGRFRQAEGGTLFLDEVGELAAKMQVKLLRVLQEREYTPLGSNRSHHADVRILAATNRDLTTETTEGRFRQDLYFRLNVVRLSLPPLRCRAEDIPLLVDHFVARFNAAQGRSIRGISDAALTRLQSYDYPGNVRELENAVEHAFVMNGGQVIELEDLPGHIKGDAAPPMAAAIPRGRSKALRDAEAEVITKALEDAGGNKRLAAQGLGISRTTLWRKMRRLGLAKP